MDWSKTIAILWFGKEGRSTLAYLLAHGYSSDQIVIHDQKTFSDTEVQW
jgi:UDP-N-acetylmuramoylalanine-D-glutamate ligase